MRTYNLIDRQEGKKKITNPLEKGQHFATDV